MDTMTEEMLKLETYPACDHRFRVEHSDGTESCWVCGTEIEKEATAELKGGVSLSSKAGQTN